MPSKITSWVAALGPSSSLMERVQRRSKEVNHSSTVISAEGERGCELDEQARPKT